MSPNEPKNSPIPPTAPPELETDRCELFGQLFEDGGVRDSQVYPLHLQLSGLTGGVEGKTLRRTVNIY